MNYRVTSPFAPPFRIDPWVDEISPTQIEFNLNVSAMDVRKKNHATDVEVSFPIPSEKVSGVTLTMDATPGVQQVAEYSPKQASVIWKIAKFQGATGHSLKVRITLKEPRGVTLRELSPIGLNFEIPMMNVSRLQVRYMRVADESARTRAKPSRWVRYVTKSASYVCRLT